MITVDIDNIRLDTFLAGKIERLSRNKIKEIILSGGVMQNGKIILNPNKKVIIGDTIEIILPEITLPDIKAIDIGIEKHIVFEDEYLIVINKPSGLITHPGAGNYDNTLVNALLYYYKNDKTKLSQIGGAERLGIVHRLDKDTSGLMLVAKNDYIHNKLAEQIKDRIVKRTYTTFCFGIISPGKGTITTYITRDKTNRLKMQASSNEGRIAITHYSVKKIFGNGFASKVECNLDTGRTHQIRVHLLHIKHPIIGDRLYKKSMQNYDFSRQALHSKAISFIHPINGSEMSFAADQPPDMQELEEKLTRLSINNAII